MGSPKPRNSSILGESSGRVSRHLYGVEAGIGRKPPQLGHDAEGPAVDVGRDRQVRGALDEATVSLRSRLVAATRVAGFTPDDVPRRSPSRVCCPKKL